MRAVKWSICCVLLLALAGCQSLGRQKLPQTPEQKLLGYKGAVEPFTKPITLRYHEGPPFQYSYRQKVLFGTSQQDLSLSGKGSIQNDRQHALRVSLAVNRITVGKDHLESRDGSTLVRFEELIDRRGAVRQFTLDTKALQKRGWNIPRRGTPQFEEFSYPFKRVILTFPQQSISMGASLKGWRNGEQPFLELARRILPKGSVVRNTLQAQAAGITTMHGRQHLVVIISGQYRLESGKDFVALRVNGYSLIDTNSDLATASILQVHIAVFKKNKHLPSYEANIHRSIVPVNLPRP